MKLLILLLAVALLSSAGFANEAPASENESQIATIQNAMAGVARAKALYNAARAEGQAPAKITELQTRYYAAYRKLQAHLEQHIAEADVEAVAAK